MSSNVGHTGQGEAESDAQSWREPVCTVRSGSTAKVPANCKLKYCRISEWGVHAADAARQGVIEMFLGLQMGAHFPSVQLVYPDTPLPMSDESDGEEAPDEPALPDILRVRHRNIVSPLMEVSSGSLTPSMHWSNCPA